MSLCEAVGPEGDEYIWDDHLWFWRLVCRRLSKVRRGPWSPSSVLTIETAGFSESWLTIYMVWNSRRLWFWCTLSCIFHRFILVVSPSPYKFVCVLHPLVVADWLNLKSVKQKWPPVKFENEFWNIRLLMTSVHADPSVISQFGFAHMNQIYRFPALFTILLLLCRIVIFFLTRKGKVFPLQARLWPRGWVEV